MKKILVLLVCLMMVTKGLAYDFMVGGIYYNKTEYLEVEVTYANHSDSYSGKVFIPSVVKNGVTSYTVASIGDNAFKNCRKLTSVTIGGNIKEIGSGVFGGCSALKEFAVSSESGRYSIIDGVLFTFDKTQLVAYPNAKSTTYVIPDGVATIGMFAFDGCINLTSLTIPNSLKFINYNKSEFSGCISLKRFIVSNDNLLYSTIDDVLFNKEKTQLVAYPNAKSASYVIPDGVEYIIKYAFQNSTNLTSLTIPNSLRLGKEAFLGCIGLEKFIVSDDNLLYSTIDGVLFNKEKTALVAYPNAKSGSYAIPDGVEDISIFAFHDCIGLVSIVIPNSIITQLSNIYFKNCVSLKEFVASNDNPLHSTTDGVLYNRKKTKLLVYPIAHSSTHYVVPDKVTSIEDFSFLGCINLTSIVVPDDVKNMGQSVFAGCRNLQKLSLPFIGPSLSSKCHLGYLFESKSDFKEVKPKDGYVVITYDRDGSWYYSYCIPLSLTEINVMKQLDISRYYGSQILFKLGIFDSCTNLEVVKLPMATTLGENAFLNCTNLKEIELPKVITVGKNSFKQCSNLEILNLPMATSIDWSSLDKCDKLKTLLLPKLKDAPYMAYPSTLVSLNIGSLEELKSGMLSNLSQLEELTIPFVGIGNKNTATGVNGLLGSLFSTSASSVMRSVTQYYAEGKSKTFYFPTNLRKVTVTEECEEVQYGAFYGCSTIKELTLPYTLYMMGEKSLFGCAGLTDIYCKGAAPAAAYDNSFTGVRTTTCKLHIPYHTADLYKASDGWNKFFYIQEEAPLTVNVTKNILNAGIILGITEYQQGASAELSARANFGYRFKYWMDNDVIVSEKENYSFVVNDDKKLMAVFVPVLNDNSLVITAESSAVNFTWEAVDDAKGYVLKIYSDAEMTKEIASYTFDMQGELVNRIGSGLSYRVADLKPESAYSYSLMANDTYNNVLSQQIGTFSTLATGIDHTSADVDIRLNVEKQSVQVENAEGKTIVIYDLQGVCRVMIHKAENVESIQLQHAGIYLVRIGAFSQKILVK